MSPNVHSDLSNSTGIIHALVFLLYRLISALPIRVQVLGKFHIKQRHQRFDERAKTGFTPSEVLLGCFEQAGTTWITFDLAVPFIVPPLAVARMAHSQRIVVVRQIGINSLRRISRSPTLEVWRLYRHHTDSENQIAGLKQDFALRIFCLDFFWDTGTVFYAMGMA